MARAVAGRLTAPKELVSCIWRRAPQIIWGGCQVSTLSSTREESSFLSHCLRSPLPFFFSLFRASQAIPEQENAPLLFFLFSLLFFLSLLLVDVCISFSRCTERERERGEGRREQKDQRTPAPPTPLMICDPLRQPGNLRTQHSSPSKQTVAKEVEKKREVSLSFPPR